MGKNRAYLMAGILILIILTISYFINIDIEKGANYIVETSLLGILIFYNPFILGIYVFIAMILIAKATGRLF